MRRRFPYALVLMMLAAGCQTSGVHHSAATATQPSAPRYIRADAIDVLALLPDPPAAGSVENELEYETLRRAVATASDGDKRRTKREVTMDVFVFDDPLGPWFNAKNCPHAARCFEQIGADARYFSNKAKDHFDRPRPSTRPGFMPLYPDTDPKVRSYPSGHSTRGTCWAELLAAMYPARRDKLLARGREIGFDRMIAGVHYPSDIYAGRIVGRAVARKLLENPAFRAEMDQVKAEMDRAKASAGGSD